MPDDKARSDIDAMKEELDALRADMKGMLQAVGEAGKVTASDAKSHIGSAAHHAKDAAKHQTQRTADGIDAQVQSNPYAACGVAFLAGALTTLLITKS